jgi:hypothetical protein
MIMKSMKGMKTMKDMKDMKAMKIVKGMLCAMLVMVWGMGKAQNMGTDWLLHFGNAEWDIVNDMAADSSGNVYVLGSFAGDFVVEGKAQYKSGGERDGFVTRIDRKGKVQWTKQVSSAGQDYAQLLYVLPNGNFLVAGGFAGNAAVSKKKAANVGQGLFIASFTAKGDVQWVTNFACRNGDYFTALHAYKDNFYFAGFYEDSIRAGNYKLKSKGETDGFVGCLDQSGELKWLTNIGGPGKDRVQKLSAEDGLLSAWAEYGAPPQGQDKTTRIEKLSLDESGKITASKAWIRGGNPELRVLQGRGPVLIAGGTFTDSLMAGGHKLVSKGQHDIFIGLWDGNGNLLKLLQAGGYGNDLLSGLALGQQGGYLAGITSNRSFAINETEIMPKGSFDDFYIVKLDSSLRLVWSEAFGGPNEEFINRFLTNRDGDIFLAASFTDSLTLSTRHLQSRGNEDFLVSKLVDCSRFEAKITGDTAFCDGQQARLAANDEYEKYYWNNTEGEKEWLTSTPGKLYLKVQNRYGCELYDTATISRLPVPVFSIGRDTAIFDKQFIAFAPNLGYKTYQWCDSSSLKSLQIAGERLGEGEHVIWLKQGNQYGCYQTDSLNLKIMKTLFGEGDALKAANIQVYPNPTPSACYFVITDKCFENLTVKITTPQGKVLQAKEYRNYIQNTREDIDLGGLVKGNYYINFCVKGFERGVVITKME